MCASPDFLTRYGQPAAPEALRNLPCLGFSFKSDWNVWPFQLDDGTLVGIDVRARSIRRRASCFATSPSKVRAWSGLPSSTSQTTWRREDLLRSCQSIRTTRRSRICRLP